MTTIRSIFLCLLLSSAIENTEPFMGTIDCACSSSIRRCAMRNIVCGTVGLGLLLTVGLRLQADEQAEAKRIIDKAIKAMGGEEKLAKYKAITSKGKGKINVMGNEIEFTFDAAV